MEDGGMSLVHLSSLRMQESHFQGFIPETVTMEEKNAVCHRTVLLGLIYYGSNLFYRKVMVTGQN